MLKECYAINYAISKSINLYINTQEIYKFMILHNLKVIYYIVTVAAGERKVKIVVGLKYFSNLKCI